MTKKETEYKPPVLFVERTKLFPYFPAPGFIDGLTDN